MAKSSDICAGRWGDAEMMPSPQSCHPGTMSYHEDPAHPRSDHNSADSCPQPPKGPARQAHALPWRGQSREGAHAGSGSGLGAMWVGSSEPECPSVVSETGVGSGWAVISPHGEG